MNVDIIMIALLGLLHYMHIYQSWMDANSQIYVFGEFVGGQQQLVVLKFNGDRPSPCFLICFFNS